MQKNVASPPLFLTARQLSEQLGISVGQVRTLEKQGIIPSITVGKNTKRYILDSVVAALSQAKEGGK